MQGHHVVSTVIITAAQELLLGPREGSRPTKACVGPTVAQKLMRANISCNNVIGTSSRGPKRDTPVIRVTALKETQSYGFSTGIYSFYIVHPNLDAIHQLGTILSLETLPGYIAGLPLLSVYRE